VAKQATLRRTVQWPWDEVELPTREVSLIKAMAAQHPEAFEICAQRLCRVDSLSFTAGGDEGRRATDFAEGMRFAGRQMRRVRDARMPTTSSRGAPPADLPNSPTPPAKPKS
jgi:hypothetical protein